MAEQSVRERLIEAAAELLDTEGPAALTTRRLAKEIGVSTMAVYTYFGGMPELVKAVVQDAFDRFAEYLGDVTPTDDPGADLASIAQAYRRFAQQNPRRYHVMFGGLSGTLAVDHREIDTSNSTFTVLVDATRRVIDAGFFQPADPVHVATQLWTMVHGFVHLELSGLLPGDPDDVWHSLLVNQAKGLS